MNIDFTQVESPIDALNLSDWQQDDGLDVSSAEAMQAGANPDDTSSEYRIKAESVDFRYTPTHQIKFGNCTVTATVSSNQSLQSLRILSQSHSPGEIYELAAPIVRDWRLHSFEESESDNGIEGKPATKIDGLAELERWRDDPIGGLPSYLAQTNPNPYPGIWFLRLVINPDPQNESKYVLSAQTFWQDLEADEENSDETFWERADAIINLANDQAAKDSIPRVAISLMFAAARYSSFEYWTQFDDAASFENSRQKSIEQYVKRFREMLVDNFDDHLEQFKETQKDQ